MKPLKEDYGRTWRLRCTGKGNGDGGCNRHMLVCKKDLYLTRAGRERGYTTYVTFTCCVCKVETDICAVPDMKCRPKKYLSSQTQLMTAKPTHK